ncbi:MAG TPA: AAA family ATPase [Gemmatimonadaceae bacterium]|nr:AAA family ATPase [Gemmatimonadaceae bacterium]
MPLLRVQTLGEVRLVRDPDGQALALRRKPLALLAYLARRAPRPATRAELSALFWGDRPEERARQSLRQALLELKQVVGDAVEVTADAVRLAEGAVALDVAEFERDAKQGRPDTAAERWAGEFFPGAEEVGGEEFERWVEGERVALKRRLGTVMQQLIGAAELRADWRAAAGWAERWAAAVPFDERAHARLVEALRMEGRASDALERHAEFATRLRTTLEVDPSPEFLRLAGGLEEQARTEAARRSHPSVGVRAPALVGRGQVLAELAGACRAAAAGSPTVVLVEDSGGCGKTRLYDELAKQQGDEMLVLRARGAGGEPYATARELFGGLRDAPGSAGASPEALAEVARLVPSLAAQFKHLPAPVGDEGALRGALVQVLAAVSEESPVLVLIDDAHEADEATQSLISSMATRLAGRVAMIFWADKRARYGPRALDTLLTAPGILRIKLSRVAPHDVEAMLASMVTLSEDERGRLAKRIHAETLGVPLLVYELVAALVDERLLTIDAGGNEWRVSPSLEGRPLPLPVAVRERVGAGLARLSPPARALVDAAAVLGTPIDGVLLEAVAGLAPDDSAAAFRELAGRHLLLEDAASPGRFDFAHPIAPRVAYALLSPSARRSLHTRAVDEMSARDMTTTAERSALPYHLARAGSRMTPVPPPAVPAAAAPAAVSAGPRLPLLTRLTRLTRRQMAWGGAGLVVAAGALLALATAGAGLAYLTGSGDGRSGGAPEARRVVVGAFQNRSGRPELDRVRDIAVDWIVRGLDETGLVEIVGHRAGVGSGVAAPASDQALREAARAARAGTIVTGTLYQIGDSIELEAIVLDAGDGKLLRAVPAVRASAADPLPGVNRLRGQIVGAIAALVDPHYDPGGSGARPPPSYEAYLAFMRGQDAAALGALGRAADEFRRAAAADSSYTLPLLRLTYIYYQMERCDRTDSIAGALDRRRSQLSRFEGYDLDRVLAWCRADWNAAHDAARRMADLMPQSQPAQFTAARSATFINHPREALERLRSLDPARGRVLAGSAYWIFLVASQHAAGEDGELRRTERRLAALPQDVLTIFARSYTAGALGRADDLERAASDLIALHAASGSYDDGENASLLIGLDELRVHSGADASRALSARLAARIGVDAPDGAAGDTLRWMRAELLYRAERWSEARAIAESMAERHPATWQVLTQRGRIAARLGDRALAARMSDALARLPELANQGSNLHGRAEIAAILGEREEAIRLLHQAVATGVPFSFANGPVYIGHANMDLESIRGDPAVQALLKPKG